MNRNENYLLILVCLLVTVGFIISGGVFAQTVKLGWDLSKSPDIVYYNIYRAAHTESSFVLLDTVSHPDSTYIDLKMQWDTPYFYVATSVDKFGLESNFSNIIDTTVQSMVPVGLYSFSARIHNSRDVSLQWLTRDDVIYGFDVQRFSTRIGPDFKSIGFVPSHKVPSDPQLYHFNDQNLPEDDYCYRLKQIKLDGSGEFSEAIEVNLTRYLSAHLYQNFPNPFNNSTAITYDLPCDSHVNLAIYDDLGREVYRFQELFQSKGKYTVNWEAKDCNGREVGSGIYYCKIRTQSFSEFRRMMKVK